MTYGALSVSFEFPSLVAGCTLPDHTCLAACYNTLHLTLAVVSLETNCEAANWHCVVDSVPTPPPGLEFSLHRRLVCMQINKHRPTRVITPPATADNVLKVCIITLVISSSVRVEESCIIIVQEQRVMSVSIQEPTPLSDRCACKRWC